MASTTPSKAAEEMVECPYNPVHRLLRKHLQKHLIKCRLSHPDVELMKCPFNALHLVPEVEYKIHVGNCPDRASVATYKYTLTSVQAAKPNAKPSDPVPVECEENWDDEVCEETYDPSKYASKAEIIREPLHGLPSERKKFRENEIKRHEVIKRVKKEKEYDDVSSSSDE